MNAPEVAWARRAWEHLEAAGLTCYRDDVDRTRVLIRLAALAAFYHSWCRAAWEEGSVTPREWASELGIIPFRVTQLVGQEFWAETAWANEELNKEALWHVLTQEFRKIVPVLETAFGGENGLFAALWLSREHDWSGRIELPPEIYWQTVNEGITEEKMSGYRWVSEGCPMGDVE